MCRYAMSVYKPHYACFKCRKAFKRKLLGDISGVDCNNTEEKAAKCPECGELMANMGLDFEAPKKTDKKAWEHMAKLFRVGITFHSCGCSGPGYIPNDEEALIKHLLSTRANYIRHQRFWAQRQNEAEPQTQSERDKDNHKNWNFLSSLPYHTKKGTKNKPEYKALEAQQYWHGRVLEIEAKIRLIQTKR